MTDPRRTSVRRPPLPGRRALLPPQSAACWVFSGKGSALPKSLNAAALLALALLAAGCQKETPPQASAAGPGLCRPAAAEALAGKARISDAEAMRLTGATTVRQIKPGDGVTMDFRRERVTVETDPASGRIIRAMCG